MSDVPAAPATATEAALRAAGLSRTFIDGKRRLEVLRGADVELAPGEVVALVGKSGSGKSTLLHLLGLLDRPDNGEVWLGETASSKLGERERSALRGRTVGFVFQHYFLLPEFNVLDNLLMPGRVAQGVFRWAGGGQAAARERALQLLEWVDLADRALQMPLTLSGGERQRVAVARALMAHPKVLLCDEPTGNLDPDTGGRIIKLIFELSRRDRVATLVVTHDRALADRSDRTLRLEAGTLHAD